MLTHLTTPFLFLTVVPLLSGSEGQGAQLEVATQNLYVGADLLRVVDGPPEGVPLRVAETLQIIQQSDFPARARGVAREIAAKRPHLVGLQEVSLLRIQSPGDFFLGNPVPASTVLQDYLAILLDELELQGVSYYVAASLQDADVELPSFAGTSGSTLLFDDVRLTDRDVILARGDVSTRNEVSGLYTNYLTLSLGGASVEFLRGFVSVEATARGRSFRVVNTHLEVNGTGPIDFLQSAQANELVGHFSMEPLPLVVLGDFNSDPRHTADPAVPPYAQMAAAGYLDVWTLLPGPATAGDTCCQSETLDNRLSILNERFDHVWVRNALALGPIQADLQCEEPRDRINGLWPSDHAGVFARIHWSVPR